MLGRWSNGVKDVGVVGAVVVTGVTSQSWRVARVTPCAPETIGCWMLDVGCWMFSFGSRVQCANFSGNLPLGTSNIQHPTSNIQHPTSNIQHPALQHSNTLILPPVFSLLTCPASRRYALPAARPATTRSR